MENNLLEILKILSSFNQNSPQQTQNVGIQSYPNEAYSQSQAPSFENNLFPLLISLLTKGNSPLTEIFAKKNEDSNHKDFQPPNDEILL